jgi:hypothetical protein
MLISKADIWHESENLHLSNLSQFIYLNVILRSPRAFEDECSPSVVSWSHYECRTCRVTVGIHLRFNPCPCCSFSLARDNYTACVLREVAIPKGFSRTVMPNCGSMEGLWKAWLESATAKISPWILPSTLYNYRHTLCFLIINTGQFTTWMLLRVNYT